MRARSLLKEIWSDFNSESQLSQDELFPFDDLHMDDWMRMGYQQELWKLAQASVSVQSIDELYRAVTNLLESRPEIDSCTIWELQSDSHSFKIVSDRCREQAAAVAAPGNDPSSSPPPQEVLPSEGVVEPARATSSSVTTDIDSQTGAISPHIQNIDIGTISPCWQDHYVNPRRASRSTPDIAIGDTVIGVVVPNRTAPLAPLGLLTIEGKQKTSLSRSLLAFLRAVAKILTIAIERKRSESLTEIQAQVLQAVAVGSNLNQVLMLLCKLVEARTPGAYCSILLLDRDRGHLHAGVAPSLPSAYANALEGLAIGEQAGSCGTAAYTGKPIIVDDISSNPLWAAFRDIALLHNINACWSIPFLSKTGEVLGTFAISHSQPCRPTAFHLHIMEMASNLASIAVEGHLASKQLFRMANYDCVTGLANRSHFVQHLQDNLDNSDSDSVAPTRAINTPKFTVLFLDIDRFKLINDTLGHASGDKCLKVVAKRVKNCLRENDLFARLGGDEFGIILDNTDTVQRAIGVAERILSAFRLPISLRSREIHTSISIGIVHVSSQYETSEAVLRDADTAMYQAKRAKQGGYAVFDSKLHSLTQQKLELELEFRQAVEALLDRSKPSSFHLVYQPIVELRSKHLEGFEALIRWNHPQLGSISPAEFIPIAEATGLIVPLGDWILKTVCQQLADWKQRYAIGNRLKVNVNISGQQFLATDVLETIDNTIKRLDIDSSSLQIEITESILIEVESLVGGQFDRLKQLDIQLCLDDFGTGYSSLSYLQAFPVNILKLDRKFIQDLGQSRNPIAEAVINLAHKLRMKVVAEGIETPEQLQALLDAGCDCGQGYLFSRPLTVEKAEGLIATEQSGIVTLKSASLN